jgi:hypothetical protein
MHNRFWMKAVALAVGLLLAAPEALGQQVSASLLKDINPEVRQVVGSNPQELLQYGNTVFFVANDRHGAVALGGHGRGHGARAGPRARCRLLTPPGPRAVAAPAPLLRVDTTPPQLTCPASMTVTAADDSGAPVSFVATVQDDSGSVTPAYSHAPGSTF